MSKLTDLIEEMDAVRRELDRLDEVWKPLSKKYDQLRLAGW